MCISTSIVYYPHLCVEKRVLNVLSVLNFLKNADLNKSTMVLINVNLF